MTTEATSLPPVEIVVPLHRALAAHGHEVSPWAIVEACRGDLSLYGFAHCAREHGLEAKLLSLSPGDLSYLRVGAIVQFNDGSIATVVTHFPSGVEVEDNDRARRRITEHDDPIPVLGLEVSAPAATIEFLKRLTDRVRMEPHVRRAVGFALLLAVIMAALGLIGPLLTRLAFGVALPDRAPSQLTLIAVGIVVVGGQLLYVSALRRSALLYLSTKFAEKASTDLVTHMLGIPLATLRTLSLGAVQQSVASASAAAEAIPSTIAPQIVDAVLGSGFLVLTFVLDPRSGLVASAAGAVVILAGYVTGRRRLALKRKILTNRRAQQQVLFETFAGIETVKSENVEGRMLTKWLDRLLAEEVSALALRFETARFGTVIDVMERVTFAAVLLFTARRTLDGAGSVADLVAAVQASTSFMVSAVKLARLPSTLADYRGDTERVDELFAQRVETDAGARQPGDASSEALVMRDVWFRYDDDSPWVLKGLNLVVRPGERLILSWPSGAGKSTLLRILAGLVPPTRGDVLLFGSEASRSRRLVTYIPQQATVFGGSVMENLRLLSGNARASRILATAELTGLMAMVSKWGMGMETMISSGVANISSGQRQLILFTAAVASEAPIVLLDEALAHMDFDMRARLGAHDFFRDRTVITVVHDASAAEAAAGRLITSDARRTPFLGA